MKVKNQDKSSKFAQEEAEYGESTDPKHTCGNCRWFTESAEKTDRCQIVQGSPDEIVATGLSNQWSPQPGKSMKHYRGGMIAIKSVGGARYAEGHLVRYGTIDDQDIESQHFSKRTNFMREAGFPIKGGPSLYEHGKTDFGAIGIGVFEFVDEDDIGIFVRSKLYEREDYERMLKEIAKRKSLNLSPEVITQKATLAVIAVDSVLENVKHQWSLGAYVPTVEVSLNGHIDQCGIVEGSLTVMPAEPNGTEARIYQKSLFEAFDLTAAATESPVTGSAPGIDATKNSHNKSGVKQMDMQVFREAVAGLLSMLDQGMMEEGLEGKAVDEEELEEEATKAAEELLEEDKEATKAMDEDEEAVKAADEEDKEEAAKSARRRTETWLEKSAGEIFTRALASIEKKRSNVNSAFKSALPTSTPQSKRSRAGAYGTGNNPAKAPSQGGKARKPGMADFVKSSLSRDFNDFYGKAQNPYIGTMGGDLLGQELRETILPPLRENVVAFEAGVQQNNVPQGVATVVQAKMTTAPTAYRPGINVDIVEDEGKFDTITAFLRPIAAKVHIPFQLLNQSPMSVEKTIREEAIRSIALLIDKEILVGTGTVTGSNTGAEIKGVKTVLEGDATLATTHIKTLATNGRTPKFSDAVDAEVRIGTSNIPATEPKAFIMHTRSQGRYRNLITTTGEPLYRDNYGVEPYPDLLGYPVHIANQLSITDTTGTSSDTSEIYYGAWRYIEYVMQDALEIIVDRVTLANQLMARIIIYTYSDILIHYPEAFYLMKGVR